MSKTRRKKVKKVLQKIDLKPRLHKIRDKKYQYILKNLKKTKKDIAGRKALLIQIDALSHPDLIRALDKGFMRGLRKLLDKKGYGVQKVNPGLPSNTAHFQSTVMFGSNTVAPGYHITDKQTGKAISIINPTDGPAFEEAHFSNGILKRGSGYCNVYSGSATEAYLTISRIMTNKYQKVPLRSIVLTMFLNPISSLRIFFHSLLEFILEFFDGLWSGFRSIFENSQRNPIFFSMIRVVFNVLAAEISTLGAILDMKRGLPIIWLNYFAFDELGHHRGPRTVSAFRMLLSIDHKIRKILANVPKEYDVYIFSDHGMTTSIPFEKKYGYSFADFVSETVKRPTLSHKTYQEEISTGLLKAMLWKLALLPTHVLKPFTWLLKKWNKSMAEADEQSNKEVVVEESSGLAHIYFMKEKKTLHASEIESMYPGVIESLAKHPAVGILCVRKEKGIELYVRGTKLKLGMGGNSSLLDNFGDCDLILPQIKHVMRMKHAGDIVIFSNFDGRKCISFANHYGLHSGLGGPQNEAFIIAKKENLPRSPVTDVRDLHELFKQYA